MSSTVHTTPGARRAPGRHREILELAAQRICEEGYEGTSIQQIAAACGLTKAGLYHHIRSKEHLLVEIMHLGVDLFEELVMSPVESIEDPVERLRACMAKNILMVTRDRTKAITIILHEHATLTGVELERINQRKKRYVQFLERSFADAITAGKIRQVDPTVATFTFLGAVSWIYKWFQPGGQISEQQLVLEMQDLFFGGLEPRLDTKSS